VGKPWGQALTQAQRPRREAAAAAPELAAPKRERVGFLERQRRKKEARAVRREAAKK